MSTAFGQYVSAAIGVDGLGLFSYYDGTTQRLKTLHCGTIVCDSGNIVTTVDSAGNVGKYSSLTIGADGLGLISYLDATATYDGDLKIFHCSNLTCSTHVRVGR